MEGFSIWGYLVFGVLGSLILLVAVRAWKPKIQEEEDIELPQRFDPHTGRKFNFDPNTGLPVN